ncbi:MAG: hypothetical protein JSS16_11465 [Proteobacteria bacterium]|nr:hypothetical protein [Pseudomonadota bacterium]
MGKKPAPACGNVGGSMVSYTLRWRIAIAADALAAHARSRGACGELATLPVPDNVLMRKMKQARSQ